MELKGIFHIDESDKWKLVINNVSNLLKDSPDSRIEIVANSEAVHGFVEAESPFRRELEQLSRDHVRLCACRKALKGRGIAGGDIFDFIEVVPSGVREILERQQEGYGYIKP